jgi:hypothetical protein
VLKGRGLTVPAKKIDECTYITYIILNIPFERTPQAYGLVRYLWVKHEAFIFRQNMSFIANLMAVLLLSSASESCLHREKADLANLVSPLNRGIQI